MQPSVVSFPVPADKHMENAMLNFSKTPPMSTDVVLTDQLSLNLNDANSG